jgi:lysyl-tRNA synthetase class 2
LRSRQRYVDLFVNESSRQVFQRRSQIVSHIRRFFEDRQFMEVETPMMQVIPGGAAARPFVTHHNALDMEMYLRIAPELFLKRLVVGGFERVFEVNRNFRNEGISIQHNPEFTMLEFYQAYATWEDLMDMTEELVRELALKVCGSTMVTYGDHDLDFGTTWRRLPFATAVSEASGLSEEDVWDADKLRARWIEMHPEDAKKDDLPKSVGKWFEYFFDAYVEPNLIQPTFLTHFPTEISPLSRRSDSDPKIADRFELFIAGREIANGFNELNDPVDQAERFSLQVAAKDAGDDEAMFFDSDYIKALSYGMPPTAGEGIGIDRLVMLLTNAQSIREVILFPTLKPRG